MLSTVDFYPVVLEIYFFCCIIDFRISEKGLLQIELVATNAINDWWVIERGKIAKARMKYVLQYNGFVCGDWKQPINRKSN